ncbi:hypothetical protein PRK78_006951 [Emydomyces testavorans]|uniref:Uncharacterized protein n=1 Tax=Emydomyces testavorans TaxID=2070801 RepID=A0AAF0DQB3_9EURO|nr:hypothetical protein PRK78_006951 [Emydomyces testavorans]
MDDTMADTDFIIFHVDNGPCPTRAITALQRLEANPEQLARERTRRYSRSLPPSPSSGETTQFPTPGPRVVDEYEKMMNRVQARNRSRPNNQFDSQAARERTRFASQGARWRYGRKLVLPFDDSMDFQANSENNVRSRWVEQGIWMDSWGPAWPKDSHPMSLRWRFSKHPERFPEPGTHWGHEIPPESKPEASNQPTPDHPDGTVIASMPPREDAAAEDAASIAQKPSVRDPEASRPYYQFLFQISKEREWIKDELEFKQPGSTAEIDLDKLAHDSVKNNWIEDGIWNPEWNELPGMTWAHEVPDDEIDDFLNRRKASFLLRVEQDGPRCPDQPPPKSAHNSGRQTPEPEGNKMPNGVPDPSRDSKQQASILDFLDTLKVAPKLQNNQPPTKNIFSSLSFTEPEASNSAIEPDRKKSVSPEPQPQVTEAIHVSEQSHTQPLQRALSRNDKENETVSPATGVILANKGATLAESTRNSTGNDNSTRLNHDEHTENSSNAQKYHDEESQPLSNRNSTPTHETRRRSKRQRGEDIISDKRPSKQLKSSREASSPPQNKASNDSHATPAGASQAAGTLAAECSRKTRKQAAAERNGATSKRRQALASTPDSSKPMQKEPLTPAQPRRSPRIAGKEKSLEAMVETQSDTAKSSRRKMNKPSHAQTSPSKDRQTKRATRQTAKRDKPKRIEKRDTAKLKGGVSKRNRRRS